jgi:prevent-host-death family protein
MPAYSVHQAKSQLSKLIQRVARGEKVIIRNRNQPVAELKAVSTPERRLGRYTGQVKMAADFDAPLDDLREYS